MAWLDPAIPLSEARPCRIIGIAGSSPAMTANRSISSARALEQKLKTFPPTSCSKSSSEREPIRPDRSHGLGKNAAARRPAYMLASPRTLVVLPVATIFLPSGRAESGQDRGKSAPPSDRDHPPETHGTHAGDDRHLRSRRDAGRHRARPRRDPQCRAGAGGAFRRSPMRRAGCWSAAAPAT